MVPYMNPTCNKLTTKQWQLPREFCEWEYVTKFLQFLAQVEFGKYDKNWYLSKGKFGAFLQIWRMWQIWQVWQI